MVVVGSMVADNTLIAEMAAILDERDFLLHFCRRAFSVCVKNGAMDALLLVSKLGQANAETVANVMSVATNPASAIKHAHRVRNAALVRRLIDACTDALAEAKDFDSDNPVDSVDLVTRHQQAVMNVSSRNVSSDDVSAADGMKSVMKLLSLRADRRREKGHGTPGFRTGFDHIDHLIGGLQRKSLVVVGAQSGVGKSVLAVNMAMGALRDKAKVYVLSHEMSAEELYTRQLAAESRVNSNNMLTGNLDAVDFAKLARGQETISPQTMWVTGNPPKTIPQTLNACMQRKRHSGLDVVFVDYLQLMGGTKIGFREQEIAEIARGLKTLAMDLDVCVVALSQLNNNTSRFEAPHLSSLRESSAIGQNANSVILLWPPNDTEQSLNYSVVKNRSGPTGDGVLNFFKPHQLLTQRAS